MIARVLHAPDQAQEGGGEGSPVVGKISVDARWRHSGLSPLWYDTCQSWWRRGRDSNPRYARRTTVFETAPFNHSGTSTCPSGCRIPGSILVRGRCIVSCGDPVVGEETVDEVKALFRLLELQEVAGIGHGGVIEAECLAE